MHEPNDPDAFIGLLLIRKVCLLPFPSSFKIGDHYLLRGYKIGPSMLTHALALAAHQIRPAQSAPRVELPASIYLILSIFPWNCAHSSASIGFFLSYRFYKCQFLREPRAQLCAWFPEKWPFVEIFVCVVPRGEPVLEKFCARSSIYKAPSDLIDSNSCEKGISREPRAQSCLRGAFLREPRAQKSLKGVPSQGTACTKVLGRGPVVERIVCVVP